MSGAEFLRGTMPDGETKDAFVLVKRVKTLHATYQVRMLTYRAAAAGKLLVVRVPKDCEMAPDLLELSQKADGALRIDRT